MKQMMRVAAMGIAGVIFLSAAAEDAYVETGTQAINTGYHVTPTTRLVIDYMILDATNAQQRIFGVRGANNFCFENYINGSAVGNSHGISFLSFNTGLSAQLELIYYITDNLFASCAAKAHFNTSNVIFSNASNLNQYSILIGIGYKSYSNRSHKDE